MFSIYQLFNSQFYIFQGTNRFYFTSCKDISALATFLVTLHLRAVHICYKSIVNIGLYMFAWAALCCLVLLYVDLCCLAFCLQYGLSRLFTTVILLVYYFQYWIRYIAALFLALAYLKNFIQLSIFLVVYYYVFSGFIFITNSFTELTLLVLRLVAIWENCFYG